MPELKVNTLRGDVLALDATKIQTVQQLKARLLEQFPCEDPIEQKIRRVEVFQGNSLLNDAQTLNEVGLDAESEVSAVYTSNEIEAASKHDVNLRRLRGFFGVKIPQDVTEVSRDAFRGCPELVKVVISDSVTSIECEAFAECRSLKSIEIPNSVTSIGGNAFFGCSSLENIDIPESVTSIRGNAFRGCKSLKSINIPDFVKHIGDEAFAGCISLKNISIPDSVEYIGAQAFFGCISLVSINIPSLIEIEDRHFRGCYGLESIVRRPP